MLDKLSRKILSHMKSNPQPSETFYDFDENLDEIAKAVASDSESVRAAVQYLHEQGYIKVSYYSNSDVAAFFYLDHKGLHYKEFSWIARKEFWVQSILTPIIVTILTTIFLNNLWPTIWHWLQVKLSGPQ